MGISGLLSFLNDAKRDIHIEAYRGKRVAVDGYVWLHRGVYSCPEDIDGGRYMQYALSRIRMLQHHAITPIVVFDGGPLPSKLRTETERRVGRAEALQRAHELVADGRRDAAREFFVRAVDVTPHMAHRLIRVLRARGVQCIVAPYEADPQLAYLERRGLVDAIITEDSDLLVFGCRRVLYKLDKMGACVEIDRDRVRMTEGALRDLAILAGCDYLENIPGLGLKTAHKLLRKYATVPRVLQALRMSGKPIPPDYLVRFRQAETTFKHAHVYDPELRALVHLEALPDSFDDSDRAQLYAFIGPALPDDVAQGIADGDLDPVTYEPFVNSGALCTEQGEARYMQGDKATHKTSLKKTAPPQNNASILDFFGRAAQQAKAGPSPTTRVGATQDLCNSPSQSNKTCPHPTPRSSSKFFAKLQPPPAPVPEAVTLPSSPVMLFSEDESDIELESPSKIYNAKEALSSPAASIKGADDEMDEMDELDTQVTTVVSSPTAPPIQRTPQMVKRRFTEELCIDTDSDSDSEEAREHKLTRESSIASITASWRNKFMATPSSSAPAMQQTPLTDKSNSVSVSCKVGATPSTRSDTLSSAGKSKSAPVINKRPLSSLTPKAPIPLTPVSMVNKSKKMRTTPLSTVRTAPAVMKCDSDDVENTPPRQINITNARLLAFKFRHTVSDTQLID